MAEIRRPNPGKQVNCGMQYSFRALGLYVAVALGRYTTVEAREGWCDTVLNGLVVSVDDKDSYWLSHCIFKPSDRRGWPSRPVFLRVVCVLEVPHGMVDGDFPFVSSEIHGSASPWFEAQHMTDADQQVNAV